MKIIRIAKKVKDSKGWVYVDLPKLLKEKMLDLGKSVDPEDLFVGEAENGIETEPHITVKYGLTNDDEKAVKTCLKGERSGFAQLTTTDYFSGDKYDVLKITVKSEDLERLHNCTNKLPHDDRFIHYNAHATVAYLKKGKGRKYKGKFSINETFEFKEVFFKDSKKNSYKIKLEC